jgi:hypothetical protein
MFGQWRGSLDGSDKGSLLLNLDSDRPVGRIHFAGANTAGESVVYSARVFFQTEPSGSLRGHIQDFAFLGSEPKPPLPKRADFTAESSSAGFTGSWKSDVGGLGTFTLRSMDIPAARPAEFTKDWASFRQWALDLCAREPDQWIFRGHSRCTFPLVTSFHREGRRDLIRYANDDVPELHRHIEATLQRSYHLNDPIEYGAMLSLAQHHGFPTPLLDWTRSPFVAAYFAFHEVPRRSEALDPCVRIYAFKRGSWFREDFMSIDAPAPFFSQRIFGARDNQRALPQQAVSMFSNVVDIESYVLEREADLGAKDLLVRVDLDALQRHDVLRELAVMGITHATLFPGIDGTCKALAESLFRVGSTS